jgi:hypothetical protein
MQFDDEGTTLPSWHDTVSYVRLTLPTALSMFYMTIGMMNHHICFGVAMNTALDGFQKECRQLIEND